MIGAYLLMSKNANKKWTPKYTRVAELN